MQETKIIQRFTSQRCIGYQYTEGVVSHSVIESRVLFTDGQEGTIWQTHSIDMGTSPILFDCPSVDVPAER